MTEENNVITVNITTKRTGQGEFFTTVRKTFPGAKPKTYTRTYERCTIPYALHKGLLSALLHLNNAHVVVESDDRLFLYEIDQRDILERTLIRYLKMRLKDNALTLSTRLTKTEGENENDSENNENTHN